MQVIIQSHPTPGPAGQASAASGSVPVQQPGWIRRIVVRIKDSKGPGGGVYKHCQVQLETTGGGALVGSSRASHWSSAFDMALARALHNFARWLGARRPAIAHRGPGVSLSKPSAIRNA